VLKSGVVFPLVRLTVLAVLVAAPAWATSLLMVPQSEASRPVCESLVEVFTAQKMTVKMAGPKSTALACLSKPQAERGACFLDSATKSRVDGIVLISATKKGANVALTMELLSKKTGTTRATQKVKAPQKSLKAKANLPVQRLVVEMLLEDGPGTGTGGAVASLDEGPVEDDELAPLTTVGTTATSPEPAPIEPKPPVVEKPVEKPAEVAHVATPPADAPKNVTLTPPVQDTPVVVAPGPSKGANVPAIVMTGVAVAAAAAAGIFGAMAMSSKGQLENAPGGVSSLSYSEAQALQSSANTNFTIALGAGIGAGVAAGVAGYLWAR
jgi:hypothetical protein